MPDTEETDGARSMVCLRSGLWIAVGLAALIAIVLHYTRAQPTNDTATAYASTFGGPFSLTAPDGTTVTEKTLAGESYAIFFGFTRCPDVCPTSPARMARLRKQLGADGMKFNIIFVSVDPEHDRPADIGSYVELFGTPILGLTGTDGQIAQIKKGYGVYSAKAPQPGGDYLIDHTAAVYLMTEKGEFSGTIDHHESDAAALGKLRMLIGSKSAPASQKHAPQALASTDCGGLRCRLPLSRSERLAS